jgi:hypothetical protein
VTDAPYTDADLRAEAASQHHDLTRDHDFMGVGESMETAAIPSSGKQWGAGLDGPGFLAAHEAIDQYVRDAADTSEWAIQLGAAGLKPHPAAAWKCTTSGWEVAIQVATAPDLTDDATTELLAEIQTAVGEVVRRVLGLKPA